jgi:hypothetical protein
MEWNKAESLVHPQANAEIPAVPDRHSSQVKLLITNNAFYIVQRATAKSKTGIFRDFGAAEAPPGFQAGWSDCMCFFLSLSAHLARSSGFSV